MAFGLGSAVPMLKPVSDWVDPRRNALMGLSAGFLQGDPGAAMRYAQQGAGIDRQTAIEAEEAARQQKMAEDAAALKTKYSAFFTEQGRPDIAQGIADGIVEPGAAYMDFIKPKAQAAGPASIQEYEYAKGQGFEGSFMDFQTQRGGASERSLNPTYLRGPDGKVVMSQANKSGQLDLTQVPDGYSIVDPVELAREKTGATVDAKTAAAARAALPAAQQMKTITEKALAGVRENMAGMKEWFSQAGVAPRGMVVMGGTEMGKFIAAASPTNAQAFMQARDMLKGGGQITDYEGRRAEDAISRMQAALDTGDQTQYLEAVADFEAAVIDGYNKLVETASGGYSAGAVPGGADDPLGIR